MEPILILIGIVYALSPVLALFMAMSARKKSADLERIVDALKQDLSRMRSEIAAESVPAARVAEAAAQSTPGTTVPVSPISTRSPVAEKAAPPDVAPAGIDTSSELENDAVLASVTINGATEPAETERMAAPFDADGAPASDGKLPRQPAPPGAVALFVSSMLTKAKDWLFGGNLVAKIGLLILFIGVSFLLKYAAARVSVPIEFRLSGVVLADIALLIWGWRIRDKRPGISLPVQGAALAILMLVTFGAFKMYHLIPGGLAFGLLFVLTAFTCLLAVLQNALWLAIFGIAGGFAAPIMTSTGDGSHIGLFSYYALMNAGVLTIALKRSWRSLNLIGFAFTFLIGTTWGVMRYVPENYLSAQLFLILFFLFYVAIAVVYATRQAPQLKHYVDATLVFGTPLVAFGLQVGLVKDVRFGLAFSALALGLFYMFLTLVLWKRRGTTLKLLAESFFALAIVFGTLAIPFALDGRWTSAAWALEGAGIVWVGLRQRQPLAWMFGLLVQAGAWVSFLGSVTGLDAVAAAQSNLWLGFLLLAATAFLMATNFRTQASATTRDDGAGARFGFGPVATVFLALASIWFVAGAWTEIFLRTSGAMQATLLVASALLAATGLGFIANRMQWQVARYFALAVQIVAGITLIVLAIGQLNWPFRSASANLFDGPFLGALMIGAGAFFSSWVFCQQVRDGSRDNKRTRLHTLSKGLLLWSGFWWFGLVLYTLAGWIVTHYLIFMKMETGREFDLWLSAYGIGMALTGPLFARLARRLQWADLRWWVLPNWLALAVATSFVLGELYLGGQLPVREKWIAYLALWLAGEWLMRFWQSENWPLRITMLKGLHSVRSVGPWLMIWPVGYDWISTWLHGGTRQEELMLADPGWFTSGSWARYLPAWVMMMVLGWLMQRTRAGGWPVRPIAQWYQCRLIPLGAAWAIGLVIVWNFTQNGSMAPLPYLPLLNPLDLSTCFAILLGIASTRLAREDTDKPAQAAWTGRLSLVAFVAAYVWFNLVLLRTVSHYLAIPYQIDLLFASQFVQAMLSLVWSVTALILMRRAATLSSRNPWLVGAVLLALVVAKLFFVDLSNVGGVERIISFVGVGLLMLAIGYVAPYPTPPTQTTQPENDDDGATETGVAQ